MKIATNDIGDEQHDDRPMKKKEVDSDHENHNDECDEIEIDTQERG